jgi:alpha,alpha-trehalase
MAGTVDLLQRGYAGLEARGNVLWFNPALPTELQTLEFEIHYRGHRLQVRITPESLRLGTIASEVAPIRVGFGDEVVELSPGSTAEWPLIGQA